MICHSEGSVSPSEGYPCVHMLISFLIIFVGFNKIKLENKHIRFEFHNMNKKVINNPSMPTYRVDLLCYLLRGCFILNSIIPFVILYMCIPYRSGQNNYLSSQIKC